MAPIAAPSIAPPFISAVPTTVVPVKVTLPFARVIRSVSSVCPMAAPSVTTLSTVKAVKVPKDVTLP